MGFDDARAEKIVQRENSAGRPRPKEPSRIPFLIVVSPLSSFSQVLLVEIHYVSKTIS